MLLTEKKCIIVTHWKHWKPSCEYCWHISLHWRHISFIHIHTSCIFNHNHIAHAEWSHKRWTAAAYKFRRWTWKCSHDFSILFHSNYFIRITYISKITGICIFALKMKKSFILRIILSLFLYIWRNDGAEWLDYSLVITASSSLCNQGFHAVLYTLLFSIVSLRAFLSSIFETILFIKEKAKIQKNVGNSGTLN